MLEKKQYHCKFEDLNYGQYFFDDNGDYSMKVDDKNYKTEYCASGFMVGAPKNMDVIAIGYTFWG